MRAFLLILIPLVFFSCTRHKLEKFNNRIVGSWQLVEASKVGIGSSNIVFEGGNFIFSGDNSATYYDRNNVSYTGSWYIDAYTYTDSEGDSDTEFILTIDVANGRNIKFDRMEIPRFGNSNRFKAKVRNDLNVVTYTFERR